ncbi:hypothetical protein DES53_11464 [Roseimicrobium gellanilyticum]|uniref:Uncharacterized protein n=1 Tax=Roseimicrobium gellanilyticum TaxID=748857 RepID=A0A366H6L6_9BACT|nr:hypothetical protein [Roseimicrobium gellanilyticum]RBP37326.1 hypothetical protein DES53_11464 [Roseimicrobium gellanilyticum]
MNLPDSKQGEVWRQALRKVFDTEIATMDLPERSNLSPADAEQCRILGRTLIQWLEGHGPLMLQERAFIEETLHEPTEPDIIFVSSTPGLVAARQILNPKPERVFYFPADRFDAFCEAHPDPEFYWHVTYQSDFPELDAEEIERAKKEHPIEPAEKYWLHREATTMGPLFGRGGNHLWKWDGTRQKLLQEGFSSWIS